MKKLLLAITSVVFILSCNNKSTDPKPDLLAAHIDSTVSPGEDFFPIRQWRMDKKKSDSG